MINVKTASQRHDATAEEDRDSLSTIPLLSDEGRQYVAGEISAAEYFRRVDPDPDDDVDPIYRLLSKTTRRILLASALFGAGILLFYIAGTAVLFAAGRRHDAIVALAATGVLVPTVVVVSFVYIRLKDERDRFGHSVDVEYSYLGYRARRTESHSPQGQAN